MKRKMYKLTLFLFLSILTACSASGETEEDNHNTSVNDVENVDVVNTHGRIEGLERMNAFYENVLNKVSTEIRMVSYTIEGAPIVTDIRYDGKSIEVKRDYTRDAYGSGAIRTHKCGNLVLENNLTNMSYIAVECSDTQHGMYEILGIDYNMSQQDLFEIELKYGEEMENKINTVTNTKTESSVERNLKLPDSVKQEVYKRLVLMNYLSEKDLKLNCFEKGRVSYKLKVHINGFNHDFQWMDCDNGKDAQYLTEMATYLIEQSQKVGKEQTDTIVQGYVLEIKDNTLLIGEQFNRVDYQWLKEEFKHTDMDAFVFDFTILEGVNTAEFRLGDKIQASIVGNVKGSKPGRATVKNIMISE
jgi:hypothetical protein